MSTRTSPPTAARTPRLEWALRFAERGWPVFPMFPGSKVPAFERDWERHATTDPALIEHYARTHPDHNFGFAPGPAGQIVIDLDVAKPGKKLPEDCRSRRAIHGAQMLSWLAAEAGQTVPDTFTVRTPSGGTHLYYRQPAHLPRQAQLPTTRGRLAGLIDTRAHGGCVVAPGSILTGDDGTVLGSYEVIIDTPPVEIAAWMAVRLADRPVPAAPAAPVRAPDRSALSKYVEAAVRGECDRVANAPSGEHNKAQMIASRALGELVEANHLDAEEALALLRESATGHILGSCGCTERGVLAVFRWGLRQGARHPRQISLDDAPATERGTGGRAA